MAIRFGANPICWTNDDKQSLGGEISLDQCLTEARDAGFEGMELGHKFPSEPAALKSKLAEFDLALVSGWYSLELLRRDAAEEWQAMQSHLELLRANDSAVVITAECSNTIHGDETLPISTRPTLTPAEIDDYAAKLTDVADRCRDAGIQLAYHHHMGTIIQTEADIDRLMAAAGPSVGLLLDTGHVAFAGADPVAVARRHKDRIVHFHAKDVRSDVMDHALSADLSFIAAVEAGVFTVAGDGDAPVAEALAQLPDYAGWLVIEAEQDPAKANPKEYVTKGLANLRAMSAAAGHQP